MVEPEELELQEDRELQEPLGDLDLMVELVLLVPQGQQEELEQLVQLDHWDVLEQQVYKEILDLLVEQVQLVKVAGLDKQAQVEQLVHLGVQVQLALLEERDHLEEGDLEVEQVQLVRQVFQAELVQQDVQELMVPLVLLVEEVQLV